jgi:hypothetical protein
LAPRARETVCARVACRPLWRAPDELRSTEVQPDASAGPSTSPLDMLDIFESLPLGATTAIVAGLSFVVVVLLSRLVSLRWMWLAAVAVPLVVSWLIYWAPYWLRPHTDSAEYSLWELLFMVIWGGAGVVVSLIFVGLLSRFRKPNSHV